MFLSGWLKFSVTLQDFLFFLPSLLSLAGSFTLVTLSLDNEKNEIGNAHPDHNIEQDVAAVCRETQPVMNRDHLSIKLYLSSSPRKISH